MVLLLGSVTACSPGSDAVWVEGRTLPSAAVSASPSATEEQPAPASPTPSTSATSASPSPTATTDPDHFVAAVRTKIPELALDRRDEEIADLGTEACTSLRTKNQDNLAAYGVSAAQADQLLGMARADLCP